MNFNNRFFADLVSPSGILAVGYGKTYMTKRNADCMKLLSHCAKNWRELLLPVTTICNLLFINLLSGSFKVLPKERKI